MNTEDVSGPGRLGRAVACAAAWHAPQLRKGTRIPYLAHLLGVASLVLEYGGDEDEVIAALLHDALEDGPENTGRGALEIAREIETLFGARVLAIVRGCTDDEVRGPLGEKRPWIERKTAYLASLTHKDASVLLVSCADKLYNARAISHDLRHGGPSVFGRFTAGRDGTLWYYAELARAYEARLGDEAAKDDEGRRLAALVAELRRSVDQLES